MLRVLVDQVDVDGVTSERDKGASALFIAARQGYVDVMEKLIKGKAAPSVVNANTDLASTMSGATPLVVAVQNNHEEAVKVAHSLMGSSHPCPMPHAALYCRF